MTAEITPESEADDRAALLANIANTQIALQTVVTDCADILALDDATINANPATYIKLLADRVSELAQAQYNVIDYNFSYT